MIPLVSIIIPTHNRSKLLVRAINSALNQSYPNTEIIVIDDASEDDTLLIMNTYTQQYQNIKYVKNKISQGACAARNIGIKLAIGDFITGLDDDDEFLPNRLSSLMHDYDDIYSFISSDSLIVTKNTTIHSRWKKNLITFNDLLWSNVVGNQILVKKEILLSLNGFDESLPSAQDYDMWLRLTQTYGPAKRIHTPSYITHTEHDSPRISTSKKKKRGYLTIFKRYKSYMSQKQRMYNILYFRDVFNKQKNVKFIFSLFPSYFFFIQIKKILYRVFR